MNLETTLKKVVQVVYANASNSGKKQLEKLFDKELFSQEITDRLKTVEDCFEAMGLDSDMKHYGTSFPGKYNHNAMADFIREVITDALNEGWVPDYTNNSPKYFVWVEIKADTKRPAGFGFSLTSCDRWDPGHGLRFPLCF